MAVNRFHHIAVVCDQSNRYRCQMKWSPDLCPNLTAIFFIRLHFICFQSKYWQVYIHHNSYQEFTIRTRQSTLKSTAYRVVVGFLILSFSFSSFTLLFTGIVSLSLYAFLFSFWAQLTYVVFVYVNSASLNLFMCMRFFFISTFVTQKQCEIWDKSNRLTHITINTSKRVYYLSTDTYACPQSNLVSYKAQTTSHHFCC